MPDLTTATTTEAPPLAGMRRYYGVWVTSIGEDGDLVAWGHHDDRRAVAAMNAYSRHVIGLDSITDDKRNTFYADVVKVLRRGWALLATVEDCTDRADQTELGEEHFCEMCAVLDDGGWWIILESEERPGRNPVMWYAP